MSVQLREVGVTADLTLLVTRDDHGTLEEGARAAVAAVESVRDVESLDVTGLRPRLNDLAVEATADLTVAVEGDGDLEAAVAEALGEGRPPTSRSVCPSPTPARASSPRARSPRRRHSPRLFPMATVSWTTPCRTFVRAIPVVQPRPPPRPVRFPRPLQPG